MDNIEQIEAEAEALVAEVEEIYKTADTEGRAPTPEENARIDAAADRLDQLEAARATHDRFVAKTASRGRVTEPGPLEHDGVTPGRANTAPRPAAAVHHHASGRIRTWADLTGEPRSPDTHGFRDDGEYFRAVLSRDPSAPGRSKLRFANSTINEGGGTEGGFMIPPSFRNDVMDEALKQMLFMPFADVRMAETNGLTWSHPDRSDETGGAISGQTLEFVDEGAEATNQPMTYTSHSMRLHRAAVRCKATDAFLEDSRAAAQDIRMNLADALAVGMDHAIMCGTGAGQPRGILNCGDIITVPKDSGQSADTVILANLVKMRSSFHPRHWGRAIWVVSSEVHEILDTWTATTGDTNTAWPLYSPPWQPAHESAGQESGATMIPVGTLLGRPVYVHESASPLGDRGDILLVDRSQYVVGLRRNIYVQSDNSPGFADFTTHFRASVRFGGDGRWGEPILTRFGRQVSWCVTLAERG